MKERKSLDLECNLAGGLPLTLTEKTFAFLCQKVVEAGYSYACLLPFRGISQKKEIPLLPLTIVHIEDAWNPTPYDFLPMAVAEGIFGYFKRVLGDKSRSILQDSLFPGKDTSRKMVDYLMEIFSTAKFITHEVEMIERFPGRTILEINPGISLSYFQFKDWLQEQQGLGLVFDPAHLLSLPTSPSISLRGRPTQNFSQWERQWRDFLPWIEVVDIHPPTSKDLKLFFQRKGILWELTKATKESGSSIKFLRVEVPFGWRFGLLRRIGERLNEALY
ncbi:MAG: hypothetical protein ACPLKP_03270 [Microgenomates group bacterium]